MKTGDTSAPETVVVLVRHGQSQGNVDGRFGGHGPTPLTQVGREQAKLTAAAIAAAVEPTALVSSDLPRAMQTMQPIAEAVNLEPAFDVGFRERGVGVFENLLFTEAQEQYPELWQRMLRREPGATPPGGEEIDAVFDRVSNALDRVVDEHRGGRIVIVSHGLAIYHALAHIFGLGSPSQSLKVFALVDNCSLSTFTCKRDKWRIRAINDRSHLKGLR